MPDAHLEDRLRNLILASNEGHNHQQSPGLALTPPASSSSSAGLVPPPLGQGAPSPTDTTKPVQPPVSPRFARKRPNQAQRRQMSAQLSVPVSWQSTSSHPMGSLASPPAFGNQHQSHPRHQHNNFNNQGGYQQAYPRPQSATVRPSHYGYGPVPSPGFQVTESAYPSQPRHHQSQSYQGPATYEDPYNWRSHQAAAPSFNAPPPRNSRPPHANGRLYHAKPEDIEAQSSLLESLCEQILVSAEIAPVEIQEKENFRARIELLCQDALAKYEHEVNGRVDFPPLSVRLKCFGSLSSGFATKASDMDLGIISPLSIPQPDSSKSPIPRLIEKAFLEAGLGARLLSRTRVPIIKLCESPPEQLRLDLLDERAKWERGILPEHEELEADEDAVEDPESAAARANDAAAGDSKSKHGRKESDLDDEHHGEDKYGQALSALKQPASQNIGNYYATAKRLLRKVGGRDITHSTAREFIEKDLKILTDVCHAFVAGLADEDLRSRLWATRSLATFNAPSAQLNYRSLYGVYMQVEGERLAMLWDTREIHEKDIHQEDDACSRIRAWKELQNKPGFGVDLLSYNKELQVAVESLRKIPSLQITTLEQGQFEPAAQYYDRTSKLLSHVGVRDVHVPGNAALSVIIRHYIAGISYADIREAVQEFFQSMGKPSLRGVAKRHKSLQLAVEFERALGKGCYGPDSTEDIKAYIDVLRMPLQRCELPGRRVDYLIPRNSETAAVISRARLLTDPSKLAVNQPRDPYRDRLEFPKTGTGVQCDINFSAHLGLQNTLLLRCYSHTDPRVRPLILFVKHWAKIRGINTPYRGTLSSYGYVLMVLHYLVNVAQPFVCPNLQQLAKPAPEGLSPEEIEETLTCRGHDVRFWRDEEEIKGLAMTNLLNQNKESIGHLLRGFFEYYAQNNFMSTVPCRGFDWGRDVLSIRTPSGLRSKQDKGWTGARTVLEVRDLEAMPPSSADQPPPPPPSTTSTQPDNSASGQGSGNGQQAAPNRSPKMAKAVEIKEVKHRFLFAIEDPFEHDHNVARTVTHSGIVAIRDEFRRAWRIIKNLGKVADENLLEDVTDNKARERDHFAELLNDIHGQELSLH